MYFPVLCPEITVFLRSCKLQLHHFLKVPLRLYDRKILCPMLILVKYNFEIMKNDYSQDIHVFQTLHKYSNEESVLLNCTYYIVVMETIWEQTPFICKTKVLWNITAMQTYKYCICRHSYWFQMSKFSYSLKGAKNKDFSFCGYRGQRYPYSHDVVTMILIEGFNHEITTAQHRLSEIVVKYSRPSWGGGTIFEAFPVFHFLVFIIMR